MNDQKNFILAIALSILVLVAWQFFFGIPQMEQERRQAALEEQQASETVGDAAAPSSSVPGPTAPAPKAGEAPAPSTDVASQPVAPQPATPPPAAASPEDARGAAPRVAIETPSLSGSLSLKGGLLDDLRLNGYHQTISPDSPPVTLLTPIGSAQPFYVRQGWSAEQGPTAPAVPTDDTLWTLEDGTALGPGEPVSIAWDNGEGLLFHRRFEVDDRYMFTVTQTVENRSAAPVTLYPYALVVRHGVPAGVTGFFILHEGPIGVIGEEGLQEVSYTSCWLCAHDLASEPTVEYPKATGGWLGFTDKYWAAAVIPDQSAPYQARFMSSGDLPIFQADYLMDPVTVAPGASSEIHSRIFAGAKRVEVVDGYEAEYGITLFDRLIDWGWFRFITRPMFLLLDWLNSMIGNFGVAILCATVLIKLAFFPLANKSYVSMSKMKLLQPEMLKIRERFKDDRMRQQQAMMELYKKEKVNPMSGCLPIVIQIPVFFSLYKVLFVTIEMRHQPFFAWIQDLSAPDPTSLFNLFGLIPWDPPSILMIGVWPLIMGCTMFLQMRLNPAPPDPIQQQIFTWMPLLFTFMLAHFAAGLVIYWAWNNTLSILQQYVIMRRQGVKVVLWDNIRQTFRPRPPPKPDPGGGKTQAKTGTGQAETAQARTESAPPKSEAAQAASSRARAKSGPTRAGSRTARSRRRKATTASK